MPTGSPHNGWTPLTRTIALAVTAGLLFAGLYALAVGSVDGRHVDEQLRATNPNVELYTLAGRIVRGFSVGLAPLATSALIVFAVMRHGLRTAIALSAAVGGAIASARLLKSILASADPLQGELVRSLGGGFYPSGHSTAVMAIVLAAVVAAPTTRARAAVVVFGGSCAAAVGASLVLVNSHLVSDVIAGYLLASVWVAVAAAVVRAPSASMAPMTYVRAGALTLLALLVLATAITAAGLAGGWLPLLAASAILASSIAVVVALAVALGRPDDLRRPRASAARARRAPATADA